MTISISYIYYDTEKDLLFTTMFRSCRDGLVREEVCEKLSLKECKWNHREIMDVFNPIFRSIF